MLPITRPPGSCCVRESVEVFLYKLSKSMPYWFTRLMGCCFEIDVSGCTWAMTPVLGDPNVTAFLKALSLHQFCSTCTPTTSQLHVAENSFTLTMSRHSRPILQRTGMQSLVRYGADVTLMSWRLSRAPPTQSAVCSSCIIPAPPANCQFIWMASVFDMSATQPILG